MTKVKNERSTETGAGPAAPRRQTVLRPLPLNSAEFDEDSFLGRWQQLNAEATIPHCVENVETSGVLTNFRRLAAEGDPTGAFQGPPFMDSDLYKTLEAIGWETGRSGTDRWDGFLRETADLLEAVQEEDGYLQTYVQGTKGEERFARPEYTHELYVAGHLIQAAVALSRSGEGTKFLRIARRLADYYVHAIGEDGLAFIDGHAEIETALVELYRETGEAAYLRAAELQIERRGHNTLPKWHFGPNYFQDHLPVRKATEATGHSVRQLYLAAGVTDLYLENGDQTLLAAMEQLWDSAFGTKSYITGAHGSRHKDEAYGDAYELPSDRAYAETCASIAGFQWCWRMLLATGHARYAEEMERALLNAIAASTSKTGKAFFYSNPLQVRSGSNITDEFAPSERLSWYSTACCPPNLGRLLASLTGYASTTSGNDLQLHLINAGTYRSANLTAHVRTGYPFTGNIDISVEGTGELSVRIPAWAEGAQASVSGAALQDAPVAGTYLRITCHGNASLNLKLPMQPQLVRADERVDAVRGCLAVTRGPIVFCVEQADLPEGVVMEQIRLDPNAAINEESARHDVTPLRLRLRGIAKELDQALYTADRSSEHQSKETPISFTAVPYQAWGNRSEGAMRIWIPTI